ncbi:MAG: hypothetical protein Q9221_003834 [Calogaya cf. arnoldii]
MASRYEIVASLNLPSAVLEKVCKASVEYLQVIDHLQLPLLDKPVEELLMNKKNSCRIFDEIASVLQELLDQMSAFTKMFKERRSVINILRDNDSDKIAFSRHMAHTEVKVHGHSSRILSLQHDVLCKQLQLLKAS